MGRAHVVLERPPEAARRWLVTLALGLSFASLAATSLAGPVQGQSVREVFDRVSNAVVVVYTSQTEYALRSTGIDPVSVGGIGSGVLISPTQVLTAAHVVQAANEVIVEFPDGETIAASVTASRQNHDVALLELARPATATAVPIGDSDSVFVGDQVFVVGAPLGQVFTLTVGYVSARRTSPGMLGGSSSIELIQTDAAINQGNSGGPMFSLDGEVIGIVSHILTESGGSQGSVVGTAMAGFDGHRGWVYYLAVHPEHRRKGIGARLMARVEAWLTSVGCMKLNLQVRENNSEVVSFYRNCGYAVEQRVSMGKVLDAHAAKETTNDG